MKNYSSLIRLHKHKVDERQKVLAGLLAARRDLEDRAKAIDAALAAEQAKAGETPAGSADYAAFVTGARHQQETIDASIISIDEEMTAAHDALRAAFQEMKKYELLEDARRTQEKREAARREGAAMDETAIGRAARRAG